MIPYYPIRKVLGNLIIIKEITGLLESKSIFYHVNKL